MVRLELVNVGIVEETGGILVVLRAPEQARLLIFETGPLEGEAIALEAEGVRPERPLTHDLLRTVIDQLGGRVDGVAIHDFTEDTFFARVTLARPNGSRVEIDARPSDAIALALRAGAPIEVSDQIMAELSEPEDPQGRLAALFTDDNGEPGERIIH